MARGRSFRTHRMEPVIRSSAAQLIVRAEVLTDTGITHALALSKGRRGLTELKLDGERQARASALARLVPVQILLPDAANLVFEGPSQRRGFLDWGLFHVEPSFLEVSRRYRRVLSQRNAWLKAAPSDVAETADPWRNQLVELGVAFSTLRASYVESLAPGFREVLKDLSNDLAISISYDWGGYGAAAEADKKLSESFARDVKLGLTHRGPHRGDLTFAVEADGSAVADRVSRGQGKLIASASILAQALHLYRSQRTKSIFLIDDFGAELDAQHWRYFLQTLLSLECQVIATSTEPLDRVTAQAASSVSGQARGDESLNRQRGAAPEGTHSSEALESAELQTFHVEHGVFERT